MKKKRRGNSGSKNQVRLAAGDGRGGERSVGTWDRRGVHGGVGQITYKQHQRTIKKKRALPKMKKDD